MKKILVIDGSPHFNNSITRKLTDNFVAGMKSAGDYEVYDVYCYKMNIENCKACEYCWKHRGKSCVINDDFHEFADKYENADIVIWSIPNYFFAIPAMAKKVMERLLSFCDPKIQDIGDERSGTEHLFERPLQKKCVLISTAGYYNVEYNFDAIKTQFELVYPNGLLDNLFMAQTYFLKGTAHLIPEVLKTKFDAAKKAGESYALNGVIDSKYKEEVAKSVIDKSTFIEVANLDTDVVDASLQEKAYSHLKKVELLCKKNNLRYLDKFVMAFHVEGAEVTVQYIVSKDDLVLITDKDKFLKEDILVHISEDRFNTEKSENKVEKLGMGLFQAVMVLAERSIKSGKKEVSIK